MIGLSKSTLEIFVDCPRCFWLAKVSKVERPRSPMPSVVNAIDAEMKKLVGQHVADNLAVPYLSGTNLVPYPDRRRIELFRSWRTFQRETTIKGVGIKAWGELDDLLVDPKTGIVTPWDYKSKGTAPDQAYCEKYNTLQGDMYHFLLEGQELKCSGSAKFTYTWPEWSGEVGEIVFREQSIDMVSDPKRAEAVLYAAAVCLAGKMPAASMECKYCDYTTKRGVLKS